MQSYSNVHKFYLLSLCFFFWGIATAQKVSNSPTQSYDSQDTLIEGVAMVKKDDRSGFVNKNGAVVIPLAYAELHRFNEGLAAFQKVGSQLWGFMDKKGAVIINPKYEDVSDFKDGLAAVQDSEKWGLIDKNHKTILSHSLITLVHNEAHIWRVQNEGGYYGYLDSRGNQITPIQYDLAEDFSEGLAHVVKNGRHGFINSNGSEVIPLSYCYATSFSLGTALVKNRNGWGYINKNNTIIIPCQFNEASPFYSRNGITFAIAKRNGKVGCINESGKEIIPFEYQEGEINGEDNALISVKKNGKWGCINLKGAEIIPCIYDDKLFFSKGESLALKRKSCYYINESNQYLRDCDTESPSISALRVKNRLF